MESKIKQLLRISQVTPSLGKEFLIKHLSKTKLVSVSKEKLREEYEKEFPRHKRYFAKSFWKLRDAGIIIKSGAQDNGYVLSLEDKAILIK